MSVRRSYAVAAAAMLLVGVGALGYRVLRGAPRPPRECIEVPRPARIDPDYRDCTIPPNIAPLNFAVQEPGAQYCVRVSSAADEGFVVYSQTAEIVLPEKDWHELLERNRGRDLCVDVYVQGDDGTWRHFDTIVNAVAAEDIDRYVVYRRLKPLHNVFTNMGMYQRDLSSYEESPLVLSDPASGRCVNCHTFANNRPDRMLFHVRGTGGPAMIVAQEGEVHKIDTRTPAVAAPASYPAWHPSGRVIAFSTNRLVLLHHTVGDSRDVFDYASHLAVYDVAARRVLTAPQIADPNRLETFPAWSPDGRYLYFCSAPKRWDAELEHQKILPPNYRQVRYDLYRIRYDVETGVWGERENVLLSKDTGLSISEPRISPDGRFLLFCMHEYGSFPVYQQSSDLYLMDLASRRYWRLDCNSPRSESWHCWSSNGRWIVFASKRRDGLFGRLYLSYIDGDGQARKPLLLPQRDATFYDSSLQTFNAPELIAEPVTVAQKEFLRAIGAEEAESVAGEDTYASPPLRGKDAAEESALAALRKAAEANPKDPEPCYRYALALDDREQTVRAIEYYRRAAALAAQSPALQARILSRLAWIYSTHWNARVRDGYAAVLLAEEARECLGRDDAAVLDALAAARAECGQFARAAETARRADTLADQTGDADLAKRIRSRMDLYLAEKPCRSVSP